MIWFTSDQHFGHKNVIKYCGRPFLDLDQMHDQMIKNHNERVHEGDAVYHLGDFCFRSNKESIAYLEQLNGKHYLIKGNHDRKNPEGFEWVKDTFMLKTGTELLWLSHYAHRIWPQAGYGAYHLYGHSHGGCVPYGRSMDVGVDAQDYAPVSLKQVIEKLESSHIMGDYHI